MHIECNTRGILSVLFRQLGAILLVFLLVAGSGAAYVLTRTPVYEAKGSMLVKFGQDAVPDVRLTEKGASGMTPDERKEFMNSALKLVQSHSLLRQVVASIGVERLYPELQAQDISDEARTERAIAVLLKRDLMVDADKSTLIELRARSHDPEVASLVVGGLMERFIRLQSEIYGAKETDFLQQQIDEAKEKLEVSRSELTAFKEVTGISSVDEEIQQLLREKSDLTSIAFEALTEAQTTLTNLEAKEAEMRNTYRDDSPILARMTESTGVARKQLEQRQEEVRALAGQTGSSPLSRKITATDERIAYLESHRGQFNALQQRVAMNEKNYEYYQQRGEEARVNSLLDSYNITRITVVDEASQPTAPAFPRTNLLLALVALGALMAATGAALARELLDDRFSRPEQLTTRLGLPVLAVFGKA